MDSTKTNYSFVQNGSDVKGATWEPDECLPTSLDHIRLRLKLDWVERQRVKEKMAQVDGTLSQTFWQHCTGEVAPSRIRTEGEPFSKMRRLHEPCGNGYIVSKDVFHYLRPISCVDDLKEKNMRTDSWLDDHDASTAVQNFTSQLEIVQIHDNIEFVPAGAHLNLTPSHPRGILPQYEVRNKMFRTTALAIEEHIRTTLMFLPLSSSGMFVQIPPLGCLSKESHRPLGFELSPAARAWGSISKDGWLDLPSLTQETRFSIRQIYDDECDVIVDCAVRNLPERHWTCTTRLVVISINALVAKDSRHYNTRLWERLHQQLCKIYDFKTQVAKEVELPEWMTCVATVLHMLRSLSTVQRLF